MISLLTAYFIVYILYWSIPLFSINAYVLSSLLLIFNVLSFSSGGKTKHCCECNQCVNNFDQHCHYLNVCIGGGNYRLVTESLLSFDIDKHVTYPRVYIQFSLKTHIESL